jgi:L-threonylcarbamoyladenylate synthase
VIPGCVTLSLEISRAAEIVRGGGVIAYPTEAVFGLGCDPLNEAAVARLLKLKQRPREQGLILLAAEFAQLQGFLNPVPEEIMQRVMRAWPGPMTWLMPARHDVPLWLRGRFETLAVRVTAHPIAAQLCHEAGTALVSTSANITGQAPARSADAVRAVFDTRIDMVLDAPLGASDRPTEIRDALTDEIIRAG